MAERYRIQRTEWPVGTLVACQGRPEAPVCGLPVVRDGLLWLPVLSPLGESGLALIAASEVWGCGTVAELATAVARDLAAAHRDAPPQHEQGAAIGRWHRLASLAEVCGVAGDLDLQCPYPLTSDDEHLVAQTSVAQVLLRLLLACSLGGAS